MLWPPEKPKTTTREGKKRHSNLVFHANRSIFNGRFCDRIFTFLCHAQCFIYLLFAWENMINYSLYHLCLRGGTWSITCCILFVCGAERNQLLVVCSLFAGRNVINYLFMLFVCGAERNQLLVVYSLFAGRNVMNHAPTAHALPVTNTKITPLIVIHESPCASVGAWFITFLTSPSRHSWFPQRFYTLTINNKHCNGKG